MHAALCARCFVTACRLKDRIAAERRLDKPGQTRRTHERSIAIAEDATGFRLVIVDRPAHILIASHHSYDTVFDPYLRTATAVTLTDPYIRRCARCVHRR